MGSIKHTAFLDLERGLDARLRAGFTRFLGHDLYELERYVSGRNFPAAYELAASLDLTEAVHWALKYARNVGYAALLLGASRIRDPKNSHVHKHPPRDKLEAALTQFQIMLARNATLALRREAFLMIRDAEDKYLGIDIGVVKREASNNVRTSLTLSGKTYFGIASSLHISRLSAYGLLEESMAKGILNYKISAVLDDRTCPVCETLDGKVFRVTEGVELANLIMAADTPEALKLVAPYPSQRKTAVAELKGMSTDELVARNYHLPPFHPLCRCIILAGQKRLKEPVLVPVGSPQQQDRTALAAAVLWGEKSAEVFQSRLFGDFGDLEEETKKRRISLPAVGLGAVLGWLLSGDSEDAAATGRTIWDYDKILDDFEEEEEERRFASGR